MQPTEVNPDPINQNLQPASSPDVPSQPFVSPSEPVVTPSPTPEPSIQTASIQPTVVPPAPSMMDISAPQDTPAVAPSAVPPDPVPAPPAFSAPVGEPEAGPQVFSAAIAPDQSPVSGTEQPPAVFSANSAMGGSGKSPKRKKRLLLGGLALVLILVLGGGYAYAFYLPNRPQAVFKTGLDRSGMALNKLVTQATEQKTLDSYKKSEINATLDAEFDKTTYSGTFNAKFDPSNVDGALNVTAKQSGTPDKNFGAKIKGSLPSGSQYPNVYFQLTGLNTFAIDSLLPQIKSYDGKWISVEADYLKSLSATPTSTKDTESKQFSSSDFQELSRAITTVTTDYVFTADSQKAVFVQKKFIAKEDVDGLHTYHYEVGLDKNHLKDYCAALGDKVTATNAYKKITGAGPADIASQRKSFVKDCQDSFNDVKDADTFNMWIDAKYKLIYKVRINDPSDSRSYTDIGQTYHGGDDVALFVAFHDDKGEADGKFTFGTNLTTSVTTATATVDTTSQDSPAHLNFKLEAKPYNGTIDSQKPAGAIPIADVLKQFGIDPKDFLSAYGAQFNSGDSSTTPHPEPILQ